MIHIEPNVLYTRGELAEMLKPAGVDVDYFIARLKPRKVLRRVFFGEDLLAALRTASALAEQGETQADEAPVTLPAVAARGNRKRRGRVLPIDSMSGFRKLDEELR